ncbi:hypothetical protein CRUP_008336 [Coryphaenoides rupestris]|nr:hypothetical protein CRUP_008336 [Coryphaenoides rupestris]
MKKLLEACNIDDTCQKLRTEYVSSCIQPSARSGPCNRVRCSKALRKFFDRVPPDYTNELLFCPCTDTACSERRRQTIVPACSYEDKEKPNCLAQLRVCWSDYVCRQMSAFVVVLDKPKRTDAVTTPAGDEKHLVCGEADERLEEEEEEEEEEEGMGGESWLSGCQQGGRWEKTDTVVTATVSRGSRWSQFQYDCKPSDTVASGCTQDNYAACLLAYTGLIDRNRRRRNKRRRHVTTESQERSDGSVAGRSTITPNYLDNSTIQRRPLVLRGFRAAVTSSHLPPPHNKHITLLLLLLPLRVEEEEEEEEEEEQQQRYEVVHRGVCGVETVTDDSPSLASLWTLIEVTFMQK